MRESASGANHADRLGARHCCLHVGRVDMNLHIVQCAPCGGRGEIVRFEYDDIPEPRSCVERPVFETCDQCDGHGLVRVKSTEFRRRKFRRVEIVTPQSDRSLPYPIVQTNRAPEAM